MVEKKKLSVEEILAAARKADSGGGSKAAKSAEPSAPAPPAESAEPSAGAAAPASKPATPKPAAKPGERPNVADILAAARAGKKPEAAAPKPAEPAPAAEVAEAAPKPAKKSAAKAPAKEKEVEAPVSAEKDTTSILAAARKATKPGPISKAEAAAMGKPVAPAAPAKLPKPKAFVPPMPVKPDYAKPKEKEKVAAEEDRRFFLMAAVGSFLAMGFTSMAATLALWTLGTARFMFPNILTEPPSKFKVGFPADYSPGYVENKFKAQYGIWVVNTEYNGQRQIFALSTVCTHLGCTPNWLDGEQKFKCPCHGSGFYKDGINFEGPAPRPLERYAIRLADDGQLEVDKSKKFQEELGQWNDSASFVTV
jgi:cytochrome b6-f complex iron-sulfur subunit